MELAISTYLFNALSIGSGGNRTVARELGRALALARPHSRLIILLTTGRELHEKFRSDEWPANVSLHFAPESTAGRLLRRRWERRVLPDLCRELAVDAVVQINGMMIPGLPCPTLAHFGDPWPYLPEAWGRWYDPALAWGRKRAHRRSLRKAAAVGFTSSWLRDLICGRQGAPLRGEVYYNGVPDGWISRPEPTEPSRREPLIVSISNVSPYKGQAAVIEAMPQLLRTPGLAEIRYRIAGYCEEGYRKRLTRRIEILGLQEHVFLEGRVADQRVTALLQEAAVYALPSICESFGIGAIEAMSFGCPVIAARAAAVPEIVGDAALLVEPGSVDALVTALREVLANPESARTLRRRGFANVERFRWSRTADRMAATLERMTAAAP